MLALTQIPFQQNKLEPFVKILQGPESESDKNPHRHLTLCITHQISKTQRHQLLKYMTQNKILNQFLRLLALCKHFSTTPNQRGDDV